MREHGPRDVSRSSTRQAIDGPVRSAPMFDRARPSPLPSRSPRAGGGASAPKPGALAAVAAKPGGIVALWVAVLAFLVMALWRLVETALGRSTDPKTQGASSEVLDRAKAFALAVVYFRLASSAFGFTR